MLIGNSLFIENNIDFLFFLMYNFYLLARVAKLADALDLGSSVFGREGSSPSLRT